MLKKLSSNILIYGATNGIKSLVPLFLLPILTAYLSLEQYGELSIIEVTILFLTPFILLNINSAINVEFFKRSKDELSGYVTNALSISFLLFCCLFILSIIFTPFVSTALHIDALLVVWIPVFILLRVVPNVLLGIFQVSDQARKFSLYTIGQTIFDFGLSYMLVAVYQLGYLGRLEGMYTSFGLATLMGIYLLYKMGYIGRFTLEYSRDILRFGAPLIPHAIGGTVMAMSDRYFISYYIGNEEVGLYTVAYQLSALMLLVGMSVNQAWSPMLYGFLRANDKMPQIIKYSLGLALFFIAVGAGVYLFRDLLFAFLVDQKFYPAKEFFAWLLLGFVFQSLYFLVTNFLFFEKRTALLAKITFSGAVLNIVLNYLLIQQFGTIGVAYATAITWMAFCMTVFLVVITHYNNQKVETE